MFQLAQGITFGESSVTGAFVEELLKNQFGEVKGKEPAYGVEIIKDQVRSLHTKVGEIGTKQGRLFFPQEYSRFIVTLANWLNASFTL